MTMTESSPVVHQLAQKGFGTGTNELYDRARPTYQPTVLAHIRELTGGRDSLNIVEIGAGTGIFTRALLGSVSWQGSAIAALRAVEPSAGMRDVFSRTVHDARVVGVVDGTFDHTSVEDGWADMVIIAQAFHWCPDHETALKEFARILKPGGAVVLVWNLENRTAAAWVDQLRTAYEAFEQGSPQFRLGLWRAVFTSPSYAQLFAPADEKVFSWDIPTTAGAVADRVCSKSYIAVLPSEDQAEIRERVGQIVEKGEGKVWIDEKEGEFAYPYETFVVAFRKK